MVHRTAIGLAVALVCVLMGSAVAKSQVTTLAPGVGTLKPERILERQQAFTIVNYREGKPWRESRLERSLKRITESGRDLLHQTQKYNTPDGETTDESWLDAKTLAPVRYFAVLTKERHDVSYVNNTVSGTVTPREGEPRPIRESRPAPFFELASIDLLYQALDLHPGFEARFEGFNPPGMFASATLRWVGEELVEKRDGTRVEALRLELVVNGRSSGVWLERASQSVLKVGAADQAGNAFWKVRSDIAVPPPPRG